MTVSALPAAANPRPHTRPLPEQQLRRRIRTSELRLLAAVATGAPMTAVAQALGVSDRTVRRRIRMLCEEIGVTTPIEAVVWAARHRLI